MRSAVGPVSMGMLAGPRDRGEEENSGKKNSAQKIYENLQPSFFRSLYFRKHDRTNGL
jgi:hypothetical protein